MNESPLVDLSALGANLDRLEERLTKLLRELDDTSNREQSLNDRIHLLDNRIDALLGRDHDDSVQCPDDLETINIGQLAMLREEAVNQRDQALNKRASFKEEFSCLYLEAKSAKSGLKALLDRLSTLVTQCGFHEFDYISDAFQDQKRRESKPNIKTKNLGQMSWATETPVLRNDPAGNAESADGDVLINSRAVGHILNMAPDDVVARARKNQLPGIKVGKRWMFRKSEMVEIRKKFDL
jgi:hypothetical protein